MTTPQQLAYATVIADLKAQRQRIDTAIDAIEQLQPPVHWSQTPEINLHLSGIEEVTSVAELRVIPADPELLRDLATQLMNGGMGMNEVKRELHLTEEQATAFFFGK